MLRQLGEYRRALGILSKLSAICPHLPGLHEQQLSLREQLEEGGPLG